MRKNITRGLVCGVALVSLSGCASLVLGGAATTGVMVAQERSAGNAVDDTVIHARLNHKFLEEDANKLFAKVNVEVHEGRVLLTGNVRDPQTMIEGVKLAWRVDGVREVINEIQVTDRSSITDFAKDTLITGRLKSGLLLDKEVRSINYTVETVNRVVYLFGIAQDNRELDHVTRLASTISGVRRVISHVRLKDDPVRQP